MFDKKAQAEALILADEGAGNIADTTPSSSARPGSTTGKPRPRRCWAARRYRPPFTTAMAWCTTWTAGRAGRCPLRAQNAEPGSTSPRRRWPNIQPARTAPSRCPAHRSTDA